MRMMAILGTKVLLRYQRRGTLHARSLMWAFIVLRDINAGWG